MPSIDRAGSACVRLQLKEERVREAELEKRFFGYAKGWWKEYLAIRPVRQCGVRVPLSAIFVPSSALFVPCPHYSYPHPQYSYPHPHYSYPHPHYSYPYLHFSYSSSTSSVIASSLACCSRRPPARPGSARLHSAHPSGCALSLHGLAPMQGAHPPARTDLEYPTVPHSTPQYPTIPYSTARSHARRPPARSGLAA
jgi:hypothetical protein